MYSIFVTEKTLVAMFYFSQLLDVVSTSIGIELLDLTEANPIANYVFKAVGMEEFMVVKILISSLLAGLYAFTVKKDSTTGIKKWRWSLERSLQIGAVGSWVIVLLNFLEIYTIFLS